MRPWGMRATPGASGPMALLPLKTKTAPPAEAVALFLCGALCALSSGAVHHHHHHRRRS